MFAGDPLLLGDHSPPSGEWSPSKNGSAANMIKVRDYQYDGGLVGDGNLTKVTEYPGGSDPARETDGFYDWRDRLVAAKAGVQASESTTVHRPIIYLTYDNLNEVTRAQRFDGDTVTITSSGGIPTAPSASLLRAQSDTSFDEQGRAYQSK